MLRLRTLAVFCLAFPLAAHAQAGSGELAGRITDPSGAALCNTPVHLVEDATQTARDTYTACSGDYVFLSLRPGTYTVSITVPNFDPQTVKLLGVGTGERTRADVSLVVATGYELITVVAAPAPLETSTGALATSIPNAEITQLPLNGRNVVNLITLAPGVSLPPGTLLPRINGGRPRTNEYLFDGISALQPEPGQVAFFPIIDDIVDFNVQSSGVSAEFGRFNGGVVNLSTRAGTDQLHGEVYEFLRNEILNAKNYFTPAGTRKPEFRRNQYGAALGGPLLHNRLFGFADYQGTNNAVAVIRTSTVPTLAQRGQPDAAGNPTVALSGFGARIYDPATTGTNNQRTEFAGDAIPIARIDPASLALLKRFPLPTNTLAANNYIRTGLDSDHQNQFDTRLDGAIRSHDRAFARYTYFHDVENPVYPLTDGSGAITGTIANTGNVIGLSNTLGQQAVVNETHTFGARTLNEARAGYTRRSLVRSGPTLGTTASAALGIPGIPTNASFSNALPVFTIAGYTQLGPTASTFSNFATSVTQFFDMVTHTVGSHTLKMGTDLRWEHLDAIQPPNPTGSFAFSTLFTNQPAMGAVTSSGGNALASFALGQVNTFSIDLQKNVLQPRAHIAEFFLEDDWRATSRLTFNLGLRYTINFASTEKNNQGAVFNLVTQTYNYLGRNGYPNTARDTHYDNLGPRLGVNYAISPRTTLRSSYGLIFIEMTGITTPFTTPQFPFLQTVSQATTDSIHPAFVLSSGPSVTPISTTDPNAGLGQGVFTSTRPLGSGYVQQWNIDLQHALTSSLTLEAGYTGTVITRVGIPDSNLNQLTAAQLATGLTNAASLTGSVTNPFYGQIPVSSSIGGKTISNAQLLKPYPRFLTVARFRNNTGRSNYNAAEFKLQQRTRYGLDLLIAYTHSKLMDDASSVFDSSVLTGPVSNPAVADTFRPSLERDASLGDTPNTTVLSAVYQLPAGRNHRFANHGITGALLGGFEFNVIATVQSGMPFAITQATNNNAFAGFGVQRPTISASANLPKNLRTPQHFINTAAFTSTRQFLIGNASRDPARGPAYRDADIALIRHISFGNDRNLELRGELFNVTNTPALAQPNGVVGNAAFGSITSTAADQRVAQLAAKLHF